MLRSVFDKNKESLNNLNEELSQESNYLKTIEINKKISTIEKSLNVFNEIEKKLNNLKDNLNILKSEDYSLLSETDQKEFEALILKEINEVQQQLNVLYLQTLLNGEYDFNNAIVMLHSGAGGTESYDFVSMLYRMYSRFCEKEGLKISVLDLNSEDEGIKSITFKVSGDYSYGKLKSEKGVHRLVRISPFDSNKRRHTTFASVDVIPELINENSVVLNNDDLKIDTYRAGGAGGQHINKTESAVRITHIPTGIVVTCQNERSQIQNKETALKVLKSKLIAIKEEEHLNKISEISGANLKIEWGNQIRSYIFCPYTLVKDHRTNYETSNVQAVMDGELESFVIEYLKNF